MRRIAERERHKEGTGSQSSFGKHVSMHTCSAAPLLQPRDMITKHQFALHLIRACTPAVRRLPGMLFLVGARIVGDSWEQRWNLV